MSPAGTVKFSHVQSWEEGEWWHYDSWDSLYKAVATKAPHVDRSSLELFITHHYPVAAQRLDANEKARKEMMR